LLGRGAHGIPYSEFAQHLTDTQLQEVDVRQGYLEGKLQNPLPDGGDRVITTGVDPQLADRLSQAKAADIAGNMVTRYGMSDHLGQMTYEQQRQSFLGQAQFTAQERQYSEEAARKIDCAVRELTEKARQQALHILQTFRTELEEGAACLLEKETLLEDELPKPDLTQLESAKTPEWVN
jgi:ATP-dependent Zn protease